MRTSSASVTLPFFIRGLAAAMTGAPVEPSIAGLQAARGSSSSTTSTILELEIVALTASMKKDHAKAIELMKQATSLEESMSAPSGPPGLIKPSQELFGEILLRAGKPAEALDQFKIALQRQPNRARSLLGVSQATALLSAKP
jgi:predicted Zn-dependent protease